VRKNTQAGRRRPCGVFFFDDRKEMACLWHSQMQIGLGRLRQTNGCVLGAPMVIFTNGTTIVRKYTIKMGEGQSIRTFVHIYTNFGSKRSRSTI
jgi:hypothetical protein